MKWYQLIKDLGWVIVWIGLTIIIKQMFPTFPGDYGFMNYANWGFSGLFATVPVCVWLTSGNDMIQWFKERYGGT